MIVDNNKYKPAMPYMPPKSSENWQKFQRVAAVIGLASATVTLIYFITKIASK
jgi:hypothetical protein